MNHQKNESKKPVIITGGKQDAKAPYGICPKMSRSQAVVVPSQGVRHPIVVAPQVNIVNMEVPCMGPRCHWWIAEWESCSVRGIGRLPEIAAALRLPKGVSRPADQIADIQDSLIAIAQKINDLENAVDSLQEAGE